MPSTKVDLSPQVSSKSLSIQSNTKKSPAKPIEKPTEDEEEADAGGVSKDKMALAMSFFANDKGAKKPTKKPQQKSKTENSDDLPNVSNATAKPFSKPTRERAYFEPSTELPDDEEDEIPNFASRRQQRQAEPEAPPPVPSRSGENKHLMLKLMKNATNALRS